MHIMEKIKQMIQGHSMFIINLFHSVESLNDSYRDESGKGTSLLLYVDTVGYHYSGPVKPFSSCSPVSASAFVHRKGCFFQEFFTCISPDGFHRFLDFFFVFLLPCCDDIPREQE